MSLSVNILIEEYKEKNTRKSVRKQKRAYHRLLRDMNIKCTDKSTQVYVVYIILYLKVTSTVYITLYKISIKMS